MILEEIDVHPCLFSEAVEIQQVDIPGGCALYIPVRNSNDGARFKQKVIRFFSEERV